MGYCRMGGEVLWNMSTCVMSPFAYRLDAEVEAL